MINTIEELFQVCGYQSVEEIDWEKVSRYQKLSENFIREFKDSVNWYWISRRQSLTENFIREFKDSVDWNGISYKQKLSEPFIREFKDSVDWAAISYHQKLSEEFIREFKDLYVESKWGRVLASEFYCGNENRPIIIHSKDPTKIHLGCFVGTQSEALEAIAEKYGDSEEASEYQAKVNKCFDALLLTSDK